MVRVRACILGPLAQAIAYPMLQGDPFSHNSNSNHCQPLCTYSDAVRQHRRGRRKTWETASINAHCQLSGAASPPLSLISFGSWPRPLPELDRAATGVPKGTKRTQSRNRALKRKTAQRRLSHCASDGRGGIRTHGTLLTYTHFPGVRLKPLGHPSQHRISPLSINASREDLRRETKTTDRERFELSIPGSPVCRFSRPVPSTTRPPVLQRRNLLGERSYFNPISPAHDARVHRQHLRGSRRASTAPAVPTGRWR